MQRPLSILWQKGEPPDVFIDIFNIRHDLIHLTGMKSLVDESFEVANVTKGNKYNVHAIEIREKGNACFIQKNYYEAMELYNLALTFATHGLGEFGLALSNRASCFFHLNMIENCLTDIKLARQTQYPTDKLPKLDTRQIKCTTLMADANFKSGPHDIWEPKLSFNEHTEFAGVADCLKIMKNDKFGRYVIATCDLKIGQTILVEHSYAATPSRENECRSRCWYCFKECMNFIPCKDCTHTIYCDEECFEKSFHKMECNRPIALSRKETFELVMRMIFKINADFPDVDALMDIVQLMINAKKLPNDLTQSQKDFCSIFQLVHNHENLSADHLKRMRAATGMVILTALRFPEFKRQYVTLKHQRFLQHLILHLFHVAEHAFELFEYYQKDNNAIMVHYEYRHFARGMYPFACFINHSCVPNVCWFNVDGRLICKVIRSIKKGDQIFRSYLPGQCAYKRLPDLKENIKRRYHLECECIVCTSNDFSLLAQEVNFSDDILYEIGIQPSGMTIKELRKLHRSQILEYEKKAIEFLLKYDRFHPVNDTIGMQNNLHIMWHVLASRY